MSTTIVYVQLGDNSSKTLTRFANNALKGLIEPKLILLTDIPEKWADFPGEIVDISNYRLAQGYVKFEKANKELKGVAGGYWLNTLKRLFVLEALVNHSEIDEDIVHLESDVFSLLTTEMVEALRTNIQTVAVPRFSSNRGIASLLYLRNKKALASLIEKLSAILEENPDIRDDMELLGFALNQYQVQELPTLPKDAWHYHDRKLIFDGAAYGQYIFGQDPFHTNGYIVSGYKNPNFSFDPELAFWDITSSRGESFLTMKFQQEIFTLANLHIHSKMLLNPLSYYDETWQNYINQANGQTVRTAIKVEEQSVHSSKPSLIVRLRIARKKGFVKTVTLKIVKFFNS